MKTVTRPTTAHRVYSKLKWSIRYVGWRYFLLNQILRLVPIPSLQHRVALWQKFQFDNQHQVETSSAVLVADLDISDVQKAHAVEYEASYGVEVLQLIDALPIEHRKFHFMDFGCGKGRVLLLASEFPFHAITGVEISKRLSETAKQNLQSYTNHRQRCEDISVAHCDATAVSLPRRPLVLFFFNPFGGEPMAKVLARIEESFQEHPREIYVIYSNPVHKHLFELNENWQTTSLELTDVDKHRVYRFDHSSNNKPTLHHQSVTHRDKRVMAEQLGSV